MFRFALSTLIAFTLIPAAFAEDEKGYLGVQIKLENDKIAVVEALEESPAAKAGIKAGDIIEKIGDFAPTTLVEFVEEVGKNKPGAKVTLQITRDGKEMKVIVTLAKRPDSFRQHPDR